MISYPEILLRLLLAMVAGGLIGFDRERLTWAAGLRTHMLTSLAAALAMLVSTWGFMDILHTEHIALDPSRVAAQVISGVGFLGAGTILLRRELVRGLTTAASLWAVAAIGLAIGGGLYATGLTATALVLVVLAGLKPLERRIKARHAAQQLVVRVPRGEFDLATLREAIEPVSARTREWEVLRGEDPDCDEVRITFERSGREDLLPTFDRVHALPGVLSARLVNL